MRPDNPPAYPCTTRANTSSDPLATPRETHWPGMTLRDLFAGQALVGTLAGAVFTNISDEIRVRRAYQIADLMLAERNRNA